MKKVLFVVLIMVFMLLLATVAFAAGTPFAGVGAWENNDADGSHQTMRIEAKGKNAAILWFDTGATVCPARPRLPVFVIGTGKVDSAGDLQASLSVYCVDNPISNLAGFSDVFSYNAVNDTLMADGQCWYRVGEDSAVCEPEAR